MPAQGSEHTIGMIAETEYGTTPATPVFETFRHTGTSLNLTKETFQSNELRDDRQISDMRHGTRQVGGEITFELTHGGVVDTMLEAVTMGAWATDTLKVGKERRSFTIERKFGGAADDGSDLYQLFTGCEFNTFSLSVAPNGIITGTAGFVGKNMAPATVSAGTYNAPTTSAPFDSFSGSVTEGGSTLALVTEITTSLENGITPLFVIGSDQTIKPSHGRSNLTGQLTAYYESNALIQKFLDEAESSLTFTLGNGTDEYVFTLPRIKYVGGTTDIGDGDEGAISQPLPFQALLNSGTSTNLQITR